MSTRLFRRLCLDDYTYRRGQKLWEDTKYMNPNENDTMLKNAEKEIGTIEIEGKPKKHGWIIIGGRKAWKRKCPICNEMVYHFERSYVYRKSYASHPCRKCWKQAKTSSLLRNCPCCGKLLLYKTYKNFWKASHENAKCRSCAKIGNPSRKGQKCSGLHKFRVSRANRGKVISPESRLKMRRAAIARMDRLGITQYRSYNPNACDYFDVLSKQNKWDLQHARNGGEVQTQGYFLDAYDKKKNIVVEYDEAYHHRPSKRRKDLVRQQEIIDYLHCDFYRYDARNAKLVKVW
jgi:hypothetical protein